jgi:hypothetical protein
VTQGVAGLRRSGWIADGAALARSWYAFTAAERSSLPWPVAAWNACANLEPTPASWRQFPELANEEAADEEVVDAVEDAPDVGAVVDAGVVTDERDGLLELPQPARSATAASAAETVPTFMEFTFPARGSESTTHILDPIRAPG